MRNEPGDVLLAGVAVAGGVSRGTGEEAKRALRVKRVRDNGRRDRTVRVKVEIAGPCPTLVAGPDPRFLAPVALERRFQVLEFQLVL